MFPDRVSFLMVRVGPVGPHDDETETVARVTFDQACAILLAAGNLRDVRVVDLAKAVAA